MLAKIPSRILPEAQFCQFGAKQQPAHRLGTEVTPLGPPRAAIGSWGNTDGGGSFRSTPCTDVTKGMSQARVPFSLLQIIRPSEDGTFSTKEDHKKSRGENTDTCQKGSTWQEKTL